VEEAAAAVAIARAARERLSVLEVPLSELTGFEETPPDRDIDRLPLIVSPTSEGSTYATNRAAREPVLVAAPAVSAAAVRVAESKHGSAPVVQAASTPLAPAGQEIPTAEAIEPAPVPISSAQSASEPPGIAAPGATLDLPALRSPAHREVIMISRVTLYVQAVLLCLVTAVAFAVGYAVGRGSSPPAPSNEALPAPVAPDGDLTMLRSPGAKLSPE
jgi:hypothetical protein